MKEIILAFLIVVGQWLVTTCGKALDKASEVVHKDDGSIDPKGVAKVAAVSLLGVGAFALVIYVLKVYVIPFVLGTAFLIFIGYSLIKEEFPQRPNVVPRIQQQFLVPNVSPLDFFFYLIHHPWVSHYFSVTDRNGIQVRNETGIFYVAIPMGSCDLTPHSLDSLKVRLNNLVVLGVETDTRYCAEMYQFGVSASVPDRTFKMPYCVIDKVLADSNKLYIYYHVVSEQEFRNANDLPLDSQF